MGGIHIYKAFVRQPSLVNLNLCLYFLKGVLNE